MSGQSIFESPIAGALGAEINGIDLTKKLSISQSHAIKHAAAMLKPHPFILHLTLG